MNSPANLEDPTPPGHCALAIGLPLEEADFLNDLREGDRKHFAHTMLKGRPPSAAWVWDGQPLADVCNTLLRTAEDLGVHTAPRAGMPELAELFECRQVVTIVAHWRGAQLTAGDFRCDPAVWLQLVRSGSGALCRDLAERLPDASTAPALSAAAARARQRLADLVNEAVIRSSRPLPGVLDQDRSFPIAIDDLSLRSLQRDRLDQEFSEILSPGNLLELADGLHPPGKIATLVPSGWSGIIDFAICNSAYLAHVVKAGRTEVRVIANLRAVLPGIRLRIQNELLRRLARSGNYATELSSLFLALRQSPIPQPAKDGLLLNLCRLLKLGR
jgi:hypothetical protein